MTIKFTKRVAAELLGRGEGTVRVAPEAMDKAAKAMTREDVRSLVKEGGVYALKEKQNSRENAARLKERRAKGRSRGQGRRKGSLKARGGKRWEKHVRSQRLFLRQLKITGKIDNKQFRRYYMLIKGNSFQDKASMLRHLEEGGVKVEAAEVKAINETIAKRYK